MKLVLILITSLLSIVGCGEGQVLICAEEFTRTNDGPNAELPLNQSGDGFAGDRLAQSFQLESDTEVTNARVRLFSEGTLPEDSTVTLTIQSDNGGLPSGTGLASAEIETRLVGASSSFEEFEFSTAVTLSADTTYWLVLDPSYPDSADDFIVWDGHDDMENGYTEGQALTETTIGAFNDGAIGANVDMNFRIQCELQEAE